MEKRHCRTCNLPYRDGFQFRSARVTSWDELALLVGMPADDVGTEIFSLLERCHGGMSLKERLTVCRELNTLVKTHRIRDVNRLPPEIYKLATESIYVAWGLREAELRGTAQSVFMGLVDIPEFEKDVAGEYVDNGFLLELCARFQAGVDEEQVFLRDMLHWVYASFPGKRSLLREQMGSALEHFARAPNRRFHVAEMLQVLREIIKGFPTSLSQVGDKWYQIQYTSMS